MSVDKNDDDDDDVNEPCEKKAKTNNLNQTLVVIGKVPLCDILKQLYENEEWSVTSDYECFCSIYHLLNSCLKAGVTLKQLNIGVDYGKKIDDQLAIARVHSALLRPLLSDLDDDDKVKDSLGKDSLGKDSLAVTKAKSFGLALWNLGKDGLPDTVSNAITYYEETDTPKKDFVPIIFFSFFPHAKLSLLDETIDRTTKQYSTIHAGILYWLLTQQDIITSVSPFDIPPATKL
jgi:hypothetical protein